MARWMDRAAGGTSQRLQFAGATIRERSRNPASGMKPFPLPAPRAPIIASASYGPGRRSATAGSANRQLGRAGKPGRADDLGELSEGQDGRPEPMPVSARTSISVCLAGFSRRDPSMVATQPHTNDSGIDTIPGLLSGNQWKSSFGKIDVLAPETTGEKMISSMQEPRPE